MNQEIITIKPRQGWRAIDLAELWRYRELLSALAIKDIKVRYKQTVLGVAWAVIQPLTAMIIFTLIFGRLAKIPSDGVAYPVFVFSGLLAWNFFSSAVASGGASLLSASSMISKVYFPRMVLPLASIGVSIIDLLVAMVILFALMLYYGVGFSIQLVWLPIFLFGLALTALGLSAWLSAVTVVYRDFRYVLPFMLQIWMYVTPVIYPLSFIPEKWRWVIYANPILGWVEGARSAILGRAINWQAVGVSTLLMVLILILGIYYFERAERRFADVI